MNGDTTRAEHLRRGWRFSVDDIGETAAKIIKDMEKGINDERS